MKANDDAGLRHLTGRSAAARRSRMARLRIRVLVAAVLAVACACGSAAASTEPEGTIAAFAAALREGRHDEAYAMMSGSYRRRVPFEEFRRHLESNPEEAREAAEVLARPDGPAEEVATLTYADGERLEMIREDGEWRIASNVVDFYDQSTPRAALRAFVRAMERERYDIVMRMVPEADLEGMSPDRMREAWSGENREEVERLLANLRAHLDNPMEQVGDRATMPYGERYTAVLVRENGLWKVEDPD